MLMRVGGVRDGREGGWPPHSKTAAQKPPTRNIHRVARSPPPRIITLNIHTNAWEDVQGPYRRCAMRALEGTARKGGWLALAHGASGPVRG